jgi:hypothetical protein
VVKESTRTGKSIREIVLKRKLMTGAELDSALDVEAMTAAASSDDACVDGGLARGSRSRRAIIAAFLANLGIALSKFVAFALTGAASMLAEAIHSVPIPEPGLLMLGGASRAGPPTRCTNFGYGTLRTSGPSSSRSCCSASAAVRDLRRHREAAPPARARGSRGGDRVLLVAVVLESFSLRTALRESRSRARGKSISSSSAARRSRSWRWSCSKTSARSSVSSSRCRRDPRDVPDEPRWDAAGSLAIGVLLVVIAIVLAVEMASLLVGEAAAPDVFARIRDVLDGSSGGQRLIALRTQHVGPTTSW